MGKRWYWPLLLFCIGILAVWPHRNTLTAERIAAQSPAQAGIAAAFLLALFAGKSLSVAFPLSVLEAAGGLLFPLPTALAINFIGVAITQTIPFLLGRRQQNNLSAMSFRYPKLAALIPSDTKHSVRTVFLLRLGGVSPGDLISFFLGATGIPWQKYLSGGLLGAFPRILSTTVLGTALWDIGGPRFWASFGASAALTALSLLLWRIWRPRST